MKPAICISGVPRGEYQKNIEILQNYFPYDFFFATWKNEEVAYDNCFYFTPPEMHYNPGFEFKCAEPVNFKDKNERKRARRKPNLWLHRTKQILIHDKLLNKIPAEYDMIIRARFDTKIDITRSFSEIEHLLIHAYEKNRSVGFCTPKHGNQRALKSLTKLSPSHLRSVEYHLDHMIFHRRDLWNSSRVAILHNTKCLIGAEYGWYQILSQPYTEDIYNPNHDSYIGFAGINTEEKKNGNMRKT